MKKLELAKAKVFLCVKNCFFGGAAFFFGTLLIWRRRERFFFLKLGVEVNLCGRFSFNALACRV